MPISTLCIQQLAEKHLAKIFNFSEQLKNKTKKQIICKIVANDYKYKIIVFHYIYAFFPLEKYLKQL